MSKKFIIAATIALNSLIVPYAMAAETKAASNAPTTNDKAATEMDKDAWLKAMEPMLPGLICKGFLNDADLKKRFEELKISYDQCVTLIPESQKKCHDQIYASIPAKINSESAGVWGRTLGECIGKDFAEKHLVPKS